MTEQKCWTCDCKLKTDTDRPCLRLGWKEDECNRIPVEVTPPTKYMPICGDSEVNRKKVEGPIKAPCCKCGEMITWKSVNDMVNGRCPMCGYEGDVY